MKQTIFIAIFAFAVAGAQAQKVSEAQLVKEANAWFEQEQYLKAYPLFSQLVSLHPQDAMYNYKFGTCAIYGQADKGQAIKHLSFATRKNVEEPMAWYFLGKAYHLNYQFREAIQAYQQFDAMADEKTTAKTDVDRNIEMCQYGTGLLANMKDVVVVNKVESDRANFFRYMNLEDIGGKILALPAELRTKLDAKSAQPGVIHYPGNSTTIYFSSYGKDGSTGKDIYSAQILPDGKFSAPEKLKGGVNTRYDEDFCFMHSDGKTLFFASKGHNSMGGYDIFKCELDKTNNHFGPAVNLDFAINTPDDDIFFIADSMNRKAWFASGRTSDLEHLHVYNVMVEGIPLQVTYLKGEFTSAINPDLKSARIHVKENNTNRTVFDAVTSEEDGRYILYIPKAGEYKFSVSTQNSPIVHEGTVTIPNFDTPVALRQELKLVKDNGIEKLIIVNHFENPLNEDLAALAAGMLRTKANLDINATPEILEEIEHNDTDDILVEHTMQNAPLAAGFADGNTVESIVASMEKEIDQKRIFTKQAEGKASLAYAYAFKKQREADTKLKEAEQLRAVTNVYSTTEADVEKLRRSIELTREAETLQREAINAMAAAEATKIYAAGEKEKLAELETKTGELKTANASQDFDSALALLREEKERQNQLRGGNTNPATELYAKAKAKAADEAKAIEKLDALREEESKLATRVRISEQEMNAAKKPKDKAQFETEYANAKAALDAKRREITQQAIKTEETGKQTQDLYGQARFFERLQSENGNLGLNANESAVLTETEKNTMRMKLSDMKSRIDALEIHDPQMLALLGEPTETEITMHNSQRKPLSEMMSSRDAQLALSNTAANSRMANYQALKDARYAIKSLEAKGPAISETEKAELQQLNNFRNNLETELAVNPLPQQTPEDLRLVYNESTPGFDSRVLEINNAGGNALDRQIEMIALKKNTIEKIESLRTENAESAATAADPATIEALARNDERYASAIAVLEKETSGIAPLRSAFDEENRTIIENDELATEKLRSQVALTEQYTEVLEAMRLEIQLQITATGDDREQLVLKNKLSEIMNELDASAIKLAGYKSDLDLTASASDAPADSTAFVMNVSPHATTTDETEWFEENTDSESHNESGNEDPGDEEEDAAVIKELFKPVKEEESIIAYETGALDEIIAEHESDSLRVNNRDRIAEIQDEIFLIEAEMENAKSESKQRSLDRDAEKLYFKKSLLEIDNADEIGKMTRIEFDLTKEEVDKFRKANSAKIDSRIMIRDEIRSLYNKAKDEMEDAAVLRKKAGPVIDDIEKNDYYRKAFAKEIYAIRMLKKITDIGDNLDMMLQYSDQELTALRYGKSLPPKPGEEVVINASSTSGVTNSSPDPQPKNDLANASAPKSYVETQTSQTGRPLTDQFTMTHVDKPVNKTETFVTANSNAASSQRAANTENLNAPVNNPGNMKSAVEPAPANAGNVVSNNATVRNNNSSNTNNNLPANPAMMEWTPEARDAAGYYSADEARSMYFRAPSMLEKDLFQMTSSSVYNESTPIPVDNSLPMGIYYKVQVGAFRNDIPQDLFDEFAPVSGETIPNGITRYTAGFFLSYENARDAKNQIRGIGYSDAFIVAFRDGKRIPLYEAMGKTEGENFMDLIEDEYVKGDSAPRTAPEPAPLNTEYYNYRKFPEAARVTMVETVQGLFYTVQVGVYSQPVPASAMYNISPLNSEYNEKKQVRYSSGIYIKLEDAMNKRGVARQMGISDAFVTAYYNGRRITLSEADQLIAQYGPSILATGN